MAEPRDDFEEHSHESIKHSHGHYHVTHNFSGVQGGFQHLYSYHDHEHDHAQLTHSHYPHENFEEEHADEAHVHDHAAPAREDRQAPK